VAAGEFVLGYENEYGKLPFVPNVAPERDSAGLLPDCQSEGGKRRSLGHNGSYLVVRQLDQHVFAFWSAMRRAADARFDAIALAAKCVGRWPSGAPLALSPERDDPRLADANTFGYALADRDGQGCPIGAHIRRTNPRDSLEPDPLSSLKVVDRHRTMRRGRSYGTPVDKPWLCESDDGVQRGLMFVGVNANIRRQFEFIQQTWVNNPKFAGLYDEIDPLVGSREGSTSAFSIPSTPIRKRCENLPRFVRVRGGEYFFLPGLRALRYLSTLRGS
jgi:Dyp-type peroxidase family